MTAGTATSRAPRRLAALLLAGLLAVPGLALASPAGDPGGGGGDADGGSITGLRQRQAQLGDTLGNAAGALEDASAASAGALRALADADARLPAARQAAAAAQGTVDGAQAAAAAADRDVAAAQDRLAAVQAGVAAARDDVAGRRAEVARFARAAYEGATPVAVQAYLAAASPSDLADRSELLHTTGQLARVRLLALDAAVADLREQVRAADDQAAQVARARQDARAALTRAQRAAADASAAEGALAALVAQRRSAADAAAAQVGADQRRYDELQAESARIGDLIGAAQRRAAHEAAEAEARRRAAAAAQAAQAAQAAAAARAARAADAARAAAATAAPLPAAVADGGDGGDAPAATEPLTSAPAPAATPQGGVLLWPADGPVTSPFGYRVHPITGERQFHSGIDIGAPYGAPVLAAAAGTVVIAGQESAYGIFTCIDHGGGLATCYAHQSALDVSVGQRVARGEVIGQVGSTGFSTGPHLHFETRVNGVPVDPMRYF